MKKLVLVLSVMLMSAMSFGQWEYVQGENKFDSFSYEGAVVIGKGSSPYTEPAFAIRNTSNSSVSEVLLFNVSYASDGDVVKMYIDDGDVRSYLIETSKDKELINILIGSDFEEIKRDLKSGKKLYIRLDTKGGNDKYEFSLGGSSLAINKLKIK